MTLLELDGVTASYGPIQVLEGVSLTVPEGGSIDAPVGTMHARLEGVNALIDNLVKLGILSQDEVSGYRMMLAMFAKPAPEGGDALVGEYEFKEGGQVFANGQQVK